MKMVTYRNSYGDRCERHGKIKKSNGIYVFQPNDTTKEIEIPKEDLINIGEPEEGIKYETP